MVVVSQLAGRDLALLKGINTLIDWAKRADNTSVTIAIATGSSIGQVIKRQVTKRILYTCEFATSYR